MKNCLPFLCLIINIKIILYVIISNLVDERTSLEDEGTRNKIGEDKFVDDDGREWNKLPRN